MKSRADLKVEYNVKITGWEGSKDNKTYEHQTHNIWLDNGRTAEAHAERAAFGQAG
jgi:hypothetical protein